MMPTARDFYLQQQDDKSTPMTLPNSMLSQPQHTLFVLLLLQLFLWVTTPLLVYHSVPMDIMESTLWGREGIIASHKHPSLPAFILHGLENLTNQASWAGYVAAQVCVIMTLWLMYRLGCHLLQNDKRALAATVLMMVTVYYSTQSVEFNHNIIQMPLWAAMMLTLFHATQKTPHNRWWWLLLGVLAGVAFYAKYAVGILYVTITLWIVHDKTMRHYLTTIYPYLTALITFIITFPLLAWLLDNWMLTFDYAQARAQSRFDKILFFLPAQVLNHAALLIVVWLAGGLHKDIKLPSPHGDFIVFFALGPVCLTFILALLLGQGAMTKWAIPMTILWGVLVVGALSHRWRDEVLGKIILYGAIVVMLLPIGYGVARATSPALLGKVSKIHAPAHTITQHLERQWDDATHDAPLAIVGGGWEAMMVAFHNTDKPSFWGGLNQETAPWITDDMVRQKGALLIWRHGTMTKEDHLNLQRFDASPPQSLTIRYDVAHLPPMRFTYVIIKPQGTQP